ncbi:SpoIIE family protein phosphatase [Streptomycetaceae bacterium NBC_01309]
MPSRDHNSVLRDRLSTLQVLDDAPQGVLVATADYGGTTVYANRALTEMFRSEAPTEPGALASDDHSVFDRNGELLPFEESPLGITLARRVRSRAELQIFLGAETPLWFDVSSAPLECHGTSLAIAYIHDVTHLKEAKSRLDEAHERLALQLADITQVHEMTERLALRVTLDDTLDDVLREGAALLGADKAVARTFDDGGESLTNRAMLNLGEDDLAALAALGPNMILRDGLLEYDGSIIVEDIRNDPVCDERMRDLAAQIGVRSMYVLALVGSDGRQLGVLVWGFANPGKPTARQRRVAQTYCRIAGQIAENNRLYEREHQIANALQSSMLAKDLPELPGLEVAAYSLSGAQGMQAGGDWYDAVALSRGRAGFTIGDVMGKGLPAATAMGQLRTGLRSYALVEGEDPIAVLTDLNRLTVEMDLTDMATAAYVTVDPQRRRADIASAGHCHALLVTDDARFLTAPQGIPLGIAADWNSDALTAELPPGAMLILYTDGLVERRGEDLDVGLERLRKAALQAPDDIDAVCPHLIRTCLDSEHAEDDVAILAVRLP